MNGKRILLWHGYLLAGSGSNIYTANIARVWRAGGHDVLLLCQEPAPHELAFVDESGDFTGSNSSWHTEPTGAPPAAGRCRVVRPAIGGVLPVYVLDAYEGFEAKCFVDLTEDELERYTQANVAALEHALSEHRPHAVVTGHEVMGPFIAREACRRTGTPYLAKLHGSALEYAVKPQERYRAFASAGLGAARVVVGGSRYMVEEASQAIPGWRDRAVVVNPGCDVDLFRPRARRNETPKVGFVGKLIAAKGVHDLLGALGLTTARLEVHVVGYGGFETELRALAGAFRSGDVRRAETIARRGEKGPLPGLVDLLASTPRDSVYWSRAGAIEVTFHGRLEHGPLAGVLPTFDVLAVPSVVPEAFGMVAAEAAACGVLPVVPRHSGIGEVGAALEEELGAPGLLTYDPATPLEGLARAIDRVLALPLAEREEMSAVAASVARTRWSWAHVAERLQELATST